MTSSPSTEAGTTHSPRRNESAHALSRRRLESRPLTSGAPETAEDVEVIWEGLRNARRLLDPNAGDHEAGDREAHRHAVIVVRLDVRRLWHSRIDDEAVALLLRVDPHADEL